MPAYRFHRVDGYGVHHIGVVMFYDGDVAACRAARAELGLHGEETAEVWRETTLVAVVTAMRDASHLAGIVAREIPIVD